MVKSGSTPAVAVPVFLEGFDPVTRRRVLELRETRTDRAGNYRFANLAPGDYRIVSTLEYASPDVQLFDSMGALQVRAEPGGSAQTDLQLYGEL